MNDHSERYVAEHLFSQREEDFEHASFDREIAFYESICSGNIELVKVFSTPLCGEGYGLLSEDPLRNLKYHYVISAALIARFCVNSGMTPEEAYNLSDIYIMKADKCRTQDEVHSAHTEMIESYTRNMRRVLNSGIYSKQVVKALDYISDHLHSRIMINDAAEYLQISPAHLSRLFKAETGIPFSTYVSKSKAEEAAKLLLFSEYTDLEISNLFCFSSQSHFITVFKKFIGVTPKEYKKQYRLHGLKDEDNPP
ncbi:MAG TPA: AraC family transcriptional regulator [Ruminococcus sp.]|nr:AraC family transcriptional regulator [Ruminococcus sp.]